MNRQPKSDRVPGDRPDYSERTSARPGDEHGAEGDREQTAQHEQPLVFDHFAQLNRRIELQRADDDRPHRDEHQQHQRRHAGVGESHDTGENADDTAKAEPPTRARVAARSVERRPYRDNSVDERVSAPEIGEGHECNARPEERDQAEGDGGEATKQQEPPIFGEGA